MRKSLSESVQSVFGVRNVVEGVKTGVKTKSSGIRIESQSARYSVGQTLSISLGSVGQKEELLEKFQISKSLLRNLIFDLQK